MKIKAEIRFNVYGAKPSDSEELITTQIYKLFEHIFTKFQKHCGVDILRDDIGDFDYTISVIPVRENIEQKELAIQQFYGFMKEEFPKFTNWLMMEKTDV